MSEPNRPAQAPSVWPDIVALFFRGLPWAKATGPMIPVVYMLVYTGNLLKDLQFANAANGVTGAFPTTATWSAYFICSLVTVVVYLALSVWHLAKNPRAGR